MKIGWRDRLGYLVIQAGLRIATPGLRNAIRATMRIGKMMTDDAFIRRQLAVSHPASALRYIGVAGHTRIECTRCGRFQESEDRTIAYRRLQQWPCKAREGTR